MNPNQVEAMKRILASADGQIFEAYLKERRAELLDIRNIPLTDSPVGLAVATQARKISLSFVDTLLLDFLTLEDHVIINKTKEDYGVA